MFRGSRNDQAIVPPHRPLAFPLAGSSRTTPRCKAAPPRFFHLARTRPRRGAKGHSDGEKLGPPLHPKLSRQRSRPARL
jgi:hypothetical protein